MAIWIDTLLMGMAATALVDVWSLVRLRLLGMPLPNYALVWRWLAGLPMGRFHQPALDKAPAAPGERWLGWCAHYLIGISFAVILLQWQGEDWLQQPTLLPALVVGAVTVLAPFCLMQPGMGLGFAARNTAQPMKARTHSFITHLCFGVGLYASARVLTLV